MIGENCYGALYRRQKESEDSHVGQDHYLQSHMKSGLIHEQDARRLK